MLIARWLGPNDYGRLSFLLAVFIGLRTFLDLGTSSAFFTFLSEKERHLNFILIYWVWLFIQLIIPLLIIGLLMPESIIKLLWQGEERSLIILALVSTYFQYNIWPVTMQMAESKRETAKIQLLNVLVVICHLLLMMGLWAVEYLSIYTIFLISSFEWFVASIFSVFIYFKSLESNVLKDDKEISLNSVFLMYWSYCKPIIPSVFIGFIVVFAERWMLQFWGGSVQQALFSVADQFAVVVLLAATAILRILWKEFSDIFAKRDFEKLKNLYFRSSRLIFFSCGLMAGFCIPWTEDFILIILGNDYIQGVTPLMIMFIYPAFQSMGQLNGALLLATSKTKIYAFISITEMLIGLTLAYMLLAPTDAFLPGLSLGATGLAIKFVTAVLILSILHIFYINKIFKWDLNYNFLFYIPIITVILGFASKVFVNYLFDYGPFVNAPLTLLLYLIFNYFLISLFPSIIGFSKSEFKMQKSLFLDKIKF